MNTLYDQGLYSHLQDLSNCLYVDLDSESSDKMLINGNTGKAVPFYLLELFSRSSSQNPGFFGYMVRKQGNYRMNLRLYSYHDWLDIVKEDKKKRGGQ